MFCKSVLIYAKAIFIVTPPNYTKLTSVVGFTRMKDEMYPKGTFSRMLCPKP